MKPQKYYYEFNFVCPHYLVENLELILENFFVSIWYQWTPDKNTYHDHNEKIQNSHNYNPTTNIYISAISELKPDTIYLQSSLKSFSDKHNIDNIEFTMQKLNNKNWISENLLSFPPISIDEFFIHGSHIKKQKIPPHKISLQIDASQAFGTGEHPTTKGCIIALKKIQKYFSSQDVKKLSILDLGCGSAILAMITTYLFPKAQNILATDICKDALQIAQKNLNINNLHDKINLLHSNGYQNNILNNLSYDIICANILANPLINLAHDNVTHLKSNSLIVLSGFLKEDEHRVLDTYKNLDLSLFDGVKYYDDWVVAIMIKNTN